MKKLENVREFYRICYRAPDQPLFEINRVKYAVLDVSEAGIRFVVKKGEKFPMQDLINGILHFPGGRGSHPIQGVVIRSQERDVALRLEDNGRIPLTKIMDEQRHLIKKGLL